MRHARSPGVMTHYGAIGVVRNLRHLNSNTQARCMSSVTSLSLRTLLQLSSGRRKGIGEDADIGTRHLFPPSAIPDIAEGDEPGIGGDRVPVREIRPEI